MDQNGDNMISEIPFSFQQLLYGDDWQLWDTFPTADNSNSADPTIEMNHNGLTVESDPLLMTLTREDMVEQWVQSSTNIEQSETVSQEQNLEVSSQEYAFTYEELLFLAEHIGYSELLKDAIDTNLRRRNYENCTDETEKCVICLNKLKYGEEASKLECGHVYHFECIKKWLTVKNMCPLCKQKLI